MRVALVALGCVVYVIAAAVIASLIGNLVIRYLVISCTSIPLGAFLVIRLAAYLARDRRS
jgi:hypothetical protein